MAQGCNVAREEEDVHLVSCQVGEEKSAKNVGLDKEFKTKYREREKRPPSTYKKEITEK